MKNFIDIQPIVPYDVLDGIEEFLRNPLGDQMVSEIPAIPKDRNEKYELKRYERLRKRLAQQNDLAYEPISQEKWDKIKKYIKHSTPAKRKKGILMKRIFSYGWKILLGIGSLVGLVNAIIQFVEFLSNRQ